MSEPAEATTDTALALLSAPSAFFVERVDAGPGGRLNVSLRKSERGRVRVAVLSGLHGPLRGSAVSLTYTCDIADLSAGEKQELSATLLGILKTCDAWSVASGLPPSDMLHGVALSGDLSFDPQGIAELLGPTFPLGSEMPYGYSPAAIFPASHLGSDHGHSKELVLECRHHEQPLLRMLIGPRTNDREVLTRTAHFDVAYLGDASSHASRAFLAWFGLWLRLRDGDELQVNFDVVNGGELFAATPALNAPQTTSAEAPRLNLALDSECGQACEFCSIKELSPAWQGGADLHLERALIDLESNARAGVRWLRLNGYDPLAFERVFEVLERARELGYTTVDIHSPCTRIADVGFLDALLERLPDDVRFYVPVYGSDAETHDGVVGALGAFAQVRRALELLRARIDSERIFIIGVATQRNHERLVELREWAQSVTSRVFVHMPYPSSESPTDRYLASVPSFTQVAASTVGAGLFVRGVPPCVYWRAGRDRGLPAAKRVALEGPNWPLPGREYVATHFRHRALPVLQSAFVAAALDCPEQLECALRSRCPGEVLHGYVQAHGMSEIRAVSLTEVIEESARGDSA